MHLCASTLTSCLPETRVYNFNYCHGWITVLGIPGFNSLRLRIGLYLFDVVAYRMVSARPLPHSLKPPRTNFNEHWTKYVDFWQTSPQLSSGDACQIVSGIWIQYIYMWWVGLNTVYLYDTLNISNRHYDDVTMGAIASQMTSLAIVYSAV